MSCWCRRRGPRLEKAMRRQMQEPRPRAVGRASSRFRRALSAVAHGQRQRFRTAWVGRTVERGYPFHLDLSARQGAVFCPLHFRRSAIGQAAQGQQSIPGGPARILGKVQHLAARGQIADGQILDQVRAGFAAGQGGERKAGQGPVGGNQDRLAVAKMLAQRLPHSAGQFGAGLIRRFVFHHGLPPGLHRFLDRLTRAQGDPDRCASRQQDEGEQAILTDVMSLAVRRSQPVAIDQEIDQRRPSQQRRATCSVPRPRAARARRYEALSFARRVSSPSFSASRASKRFSHSVCCCCVAGVICACRARLRGPGSWRTSGRSDSCSRAERSSSCRVATSPSRRGPGCRPGP